MLRHSLVSLSLKIGLSISLLYTSLASFVVPNLVVERWPLFISNNLNESFLAAFTGLLALFFIVWIFSGKYRFSAYSAIGGLIILTGIINARNVPLLFDLAPLLFIAIALALRYYPRIRVVAETKVTPLTTHTNSQQSNKQQNNQPNGDSHDQHLFVTKR